MLGIAVPAFAQNENQGDKKDQPKQQQKANEQARPAQQHAQQPQRQEQNNKQQQQVQQQQKQDQNKQQQQRAQEQKNQDKQKKQAQQQRTQAQQRVEQSTWQNHRSANWQSDHRSWQQRGGYNGYRIPQDRYRGYFGSQHFFRIYGLPFMVYNGYPRFQYEGYWITLLDPWPSYWSTDWYDNDDVYIAYGDDGYYMYNRQYPGIGIAVSISM